VRWFEPLTQLSESGATNRIRTCKHEGLSFAALPVCVQSHWYGWGDSNSQSAGSKPAAFAILATPAHLEFSKNSPVLRSKATQLGKTKPAHFERVGVLRIIRSLWLIQGTPTHTQAIQ
jgi:hypothetical protein